MSGANGQTAGRVGALMRTEVFRLRRRKAWPGVIEEAGLPAEVGGRIGEIVRRARLWNRESVEVARELVAHALEAQDRGVSEREIAEGLGEPRVVAKLIRRAVRRKRPVWWHARVWLVRSAAGVIGLTVIVVGGILGRTFIGDPEPSHSFIADLNSPLNELGDDEKAWPLYRDVYREIARTTTPVRNQMLDRAAQHVARNNSELALGVKEAGLDMLPKIDPAHPDYAGVLGVLEEIQPALHTLKQAASRPMVGRLYSSKQEEYDRYKSLLPEPIPEPADPAEQGMLIGVMLPHLSPMRSFSRWLAFEARVAVRAGDGSQAAESLRAIHGMARQVEREPFLISYFVAVALDMLAIETVDWALETHPDSFSRDDLAGLAHVVSNARHGIPSLPLRGERMMFEDVLQHTFTDDGRGDGHITNEGIRMLTMVDSMSAGSAFEESAAMLGAVALASRAEQRRAYSELIARARADADAGYEIYRGRGLESEAWLAKNEDRYSIAPVTMLVPAYGKALHAQNEAMVKLDATLAAIAAELFRRDTGAWPGSLDELVPRYLPTAPEDPFDGGPLRLAMGKTGPVIYSIGPDRVDDGGDPGENRGTRLNMYLRFSGDGDPMALGDWILYPPSARP